MGIERMVTEGMREKYDPDRGPEAGYPGSDQHQELRGTAGRLGGWTSRASTSRT